MCEHNFFFLKGSSLVKGFQSKNYVMVKRRQTSVSMKALGSNAAGHANFSKLAYLCLQNMEILQNENPGNF